MIRVSRNTSVGTATGRATRSGVGAVASGSRVPLAVRSGRPHAVPGLQHAKAIMPDAIYKQELKAPAVAGCQGTASRWPTVIDNCWPAFFLVTAPMA